MARHLIVAHASISETSRRKRYLVVIKASCSNPYRRVELQLPFHSILVRLVKVLELEGSNSEPKATFYAWQDSLPPRVVCRPAGTMKFIVGVNGFIPPLTASVRFFDRWPWSVFSLDIDLIGISSPYPSASEFPVHRVVGIVTITPIDNPVE